jgi:hypothetical protein
LLHEPRNLRHRLALGEQLLMAGEDLNEGFGVHLVVAGFGLALAFALGR